MSPYSRRWYETFLHRIPAARTDQEVAFLRRVLPLGSYRTVLDVCCGAGRHATPLARAGHRVTGVDIDVDVLARARRVDPDNPRFLQGDMRDLTMLEGDIFDAAFIMWQSWGYFSPSENDAVLAGMASKLRPGGRLVLDIYHRDFFEAHQGVRMREEAGQAIVETKSMDGNRLRVELTYDGSPLDRFEWELCTPHDLEVRARALGLEPVVVCAGFDEAVRATGDRPRFQAVFERT